MTPLQIQILLHYHTEPEDYFELTQDEAENFLGNGYLVKGEKAFMPTEKLHFYCDYLCSIPEPVCQFRMPPRSIHTPCRPSERADKNVKVDLES